MLKDPEKPKNVDPTRIVTRSKTGKNLFPIFVFPKTDVHISFEQVNKRYLVTAVEDLLKAYFELNNLDFMLYMYSG